VTQVTGYKLVNSLADLNQVSLDLAGNYALGKDVDATTAPTAYVPIGTGATRFTGQFDGMGHTIANIYVEQAVAIAPGQYAVVASGLFGVIGTAGVVRDISVNGTGGGVGDYGIYDGILAGVNYGTIAGAHTSGRVLAISNESIRFVSGGLVGGNYGTVTRSSSDAKVSADGTLGGLVGRNFNTGVIRQSYASGVVFAYGHGAGAGGLVGTNEGLITQSYATGPVTFLPSYCGGYITPHGACTSGAAALVQSNYGTIEQSFATGKVTQIFTFAGGPPPLGIASTNNGTVANDVYWNIETTQATLGVYRGTSVPAANGLTTAQMSTPSSFVSYDFSPTGVWAMPAGATHPILRWQLEH